MRDPVPPDQLLWIQQDPRPKKAACPQTMLCGREDLHDGFVLPTKSSLKKRCEKRRNVRLPFVYLSLMCTLSQLVHRVFAPPGRQQNQQREDCGSKLLQSVAVGVTPVVRRCLGPRRPAVGWANVPGLRSCQPQQLRQLLKATATARSMCDERRRKKPQ